MHTGTGTIRVSQVLVRFSPHMPRSSWTPTDPRKAHQCAFSVLASGPLKSSPSAFGRFSSPTQITGLYQASGNTVSLVACVVPCVRFNEVVRSLMSEICVPVSRFVEVAGIPSPTPRFSLFDGNFSNRS